MTLARVCSKSIWWSAHDRARPFRSPPPGAIVIAWIALTVLGAYAANAVSSRWLEQFSIPGYSAYEANQRALKTFGTGENAPLVAVFTRSRRRHQDRRDQSRDHGCGEPESRLAGQRRTSRPAATRTSRPTAKRPSPISTRPATRASTGPIKIGEARSALKAGDAPGVTSYLTGRDALQEARERR